MPEIISISQLRGTNVSLYAVVWDVPKTCYEIENQDVLLLRSLKNQPAVVSNVLSGCVADSCRQTFGGGVVDLTSIISVSEED